MSHAKTKLGLAIAAIVGTVSVAQAGGHIKEKGISVSGHVNQMVRLSDFDDSSDTQIVDNGTNASRISLTANGGFAGMDVEVFSQFRWNANNSATTMPDFIGMSTDDAEGLSAAYLDVAFKHELGTFSIGRGDSAARYTQRQDLSGTELINNFDIRRLPSGDENRVGFEGQRTDRVRYDAPTLLGTNFSVSADSDGSTEIGLRWGSEIEAYSNSMDGMRWSGALGYSNNSDDEFELDLGSLSLAPGESDDRISASFSALFEGGFNVTLGYGEESFVSVDDDLEGTFVKVGQRAGQHAFSISFSNLEMGTQEADTTGVGYQFNGDNGVDVYAGYMQFDPDGGEEYDQFSVGSRVRF